MATYSHRRPFEIRGKMGGLGGYQPRAAWTSQARLTAVAERASILAALDSSPLLWRMRGSTLDVTRLISSTNFSTIQERKGELATSPIQVVFVAFESKASVVRGTLRLSKAVLGNSHLTFVRYSSDGWRTYQDTVSVHVADDNAANFCFFTMKTSEPLLESCKESSQGYFNEQESTSKSTLAFAVCCQSETGATYWENNGGKNFEMTITSMRTQPAPRFKSNGEKKSPTAQSTLSVF